MRADQLLQKLGYTRSRESAKKLILLGSVSVNGKKLTKPSQVLDDAEDYEIVVTDKPKYVSRGGYKLEGILDDAKIDVNDAVCIDIGSSTGGFTDCLLQRGAKHVFCVDSGNDQLSKILREDERTTVLENTNARMLSHNEIPVLADIIVMDVSFISQTLIHPSVSKFLADNGLFITLIKPQFELTRSEIGKGGLVKDKENRHSAIRRVVFSCERFGLMPLMISDSKITGGDGNIEYTAVFKHGESQINTDEIIRTLK